MAAVLLGVDCEMLTKKVAVVDDCASEFYLFFSDLLSNKTLQSCGVIWGFIIKCVAI